MREETRITVGELAKKANVSVRTLQYYDRIGLLKPSALSSGGRRLYNENDMALLHQIITLKSVGLSLDEIKTKIIPVNNDEDVLLILEHQSNIIKEQISQLNKTLESIEMIKHEINEHEQVNWSKYSNMMKLISDNNEFYWVINYLEDEVIKRITDVHQDQSDSNQPLEWVMNCLHQAIQLEEAGILPESEEAQDLASEWWHFMKQYTNGNMNQLEQLYAIYNTTDKWPHEFEQLQKKSQVYFEKVIEIFLNNMNLI